MARSFSVSDFKSNLQFGGARQTLFQCQINAPAGIPGLDFRKAPFLVKSASIPESYLGTINVPYFGRVVKMGGDRSFQPWQVTVINDEDFKIRNGLEAWSNSINNMRGNIRLSGASVLSYKATATVTQYGKTGDILRTYNFEGLYPQDIAAINLGWDQQNLIEEFNVTFDYDNWVLAPQSPTGSIGNQG